MSLGFLDVYLDASGKRSGAYDRLITVNGCAATSEQWAAFDEEWQVTLQGYGFTADTATERHVFHTTDFHSGFCKFAPKNLTPAEKQRIYRNLIQIICKYTSYKFGYGVLLRDYEAFATEYPYLTKGLFGHPGTMVAVLATARCIDWAGEKGYSKSLSMIFDRGDEFWGNMYTSFVDFVKSGHPANKDIRLNIDSLVPGNKSVYSPLQAADILAWESRKYFSKASLPRITPVGLMAPRTELKMLCETDSYLTAYRYEDLVKRVEQLIEARLFDLGGTTIMKCEALAKQHADSITEKLRLKKERRDARKETKS